MSSQSRMHVLCIYRKMIPSVRLCGHAQLTELAEQGKIEYRAIQENRIWTKVLNWADVIILGKLDSWAEERITEACADTGRKILYILDDDLLNIPKEIGSAANYGQPSVRLHIQQMIALSDVILSPSPVLLGRYAKDGRTGIQIEEPAIQPATFVSHTGKEKIKIGFAGSPDRTNDIEELLKSVLVQTKKKYQDRIQIEFFGVKPSFLDEIGATYYPFTNSYDEYRAELNRLEWDIGLAPLPNTEFHSCKHYNKFTEYSAEGIVGIYSDVAPYNRLPKIYSDVILVPNETESWREALWHLLDDEDGREKQREQVLQCAKAALNVSECAKPLEAYLGNLDIEKTNCHANDAVLLMMKAGNVFARGTTKLRGMLRKR